MRVMITEPIAQAGIDILKKSAEVDFIPGLSRDELLGIIPDYEGLLVRSMTQVTREVIEAGVSLKVIGRAGSGLNNIDVAAARKRGIKVVDASGANAISAAEHTFALLLALCRRITQANRSLVLEGKWDRTTFMGVELYGKCLGIIGFGQIGKEVSKRALAFGMHVVAYDPYIPNSEFVEQGVISAGLSDLLARSDFISVHVPLTSETALMIGKDELSMVKEGAVFVNCARGGIVDELALYDALISGRLAGAALDVFASEPAANNPLINLDSVIATPHLGGSTAEAQHRCAVVVATAILEALNGSGRLGVELVATNNAANGELH